MRIGTAELTVKKGDITQEVVDVIVNAANSGLIGGGGVDGAIHLAGGPAIMEECREIRLRQGYCAIGEAVVTTAGCLKAGRVVHTVGPVWRGGADNEDELLRKAYWNALTLACRLGARSVAFPSISTGAYRFPVKRAAEIALRTAGEFLQGDNELETVRLVLFTDSDLNIYSNVLSKMEIR